MTVLSTHAELDVGRVVGRGGFSVVSEVQGVKINEVYDTSDEDAAVRRQFAETCQVDDPNNRYVIKVLRTDLSEEEHTKGIVDLAVEANFLETISHPNIISMRAMANSDPYENRFFVILDLLNMTLEKKMNFWRKQVGEYAGVWMGLCCGYCFANKQGLYRLWMERIMVSRDIANAIYYLHRNDIVYRDLVSNHNVEQEFVCLRYTYISCVFRNQTTSASTRTAKSRFSTLAWQNGWTLWIRQTMACIE